MRRKALKILTIAGGLSAQIMLMWHFSNIVRLGRHYISEPRPVVLYGEILLLLLLIIMSVYTLISEYKETSHAKINPRNTAKAIR